MNAATPTSPRPERNPPSRLPSAEAVPRVSGHRIQDVFRDPEYGSKDDPGCHEGEDKREFIGADVVSTGAYAGEEDPRNDAERPVKPQREPGEEEERLPEDDGVQDKMGDERRPV